MPSPSTFISYSWESEGHKDWVSALAERLRDNGVKVVFDRWELRPGDQLPEFMERAVRENTAVAIICTPAYKSRSDGRCGGVGYEGDIMTAEVCNLRNRRKFIPIHRSGDWTEAAPTWLLGSYRIDMRGQSSYDRSFAELLNAIFQLQEVDDTLIPPANVPAPSDEIIRCKKCRVMLDPEATICRGCGYEIYFGNDRSEKTPHILAGAYLATVSLALLTHMMLDTGFAASVAVAVTISSTAGFWIWSKLDDRIKRKFRRPSQPKRTT